MNSFPARRLPLDQAHGLRRLYAGQRVRFVPVVSNPHILLGGLLLERLCAAFGVHGARTLVVDASESAMLADSSVLAEVGGHIEALSHQVAYLAARGLPARCIDSDGFTSAFLDLIGDAAGEIDVVLVHAPAADLCRMFSQHDLRHAARREAYPLLLCDDRPASVTHAYGALKLLAQRAELIVHDVLLGASAHSPRAARIGDQLAACAELYLHATVRFALCIDPADDVDEAVTPELSRWAQQWLGTGGLAGASLHPTAAAQHDAHALN